MSTAYRNSTPTFVSFRRPFRLFLINQGFFLLTLLIMGAILAVWR